MSSPLTRAAVVFWVGILASVFFALLPALAHPSQIAIGSPAGEATTHIFGLWAGLDGGHPFLRQSALANHPVGMSVDLADPVNLPYMLPALVWGLPGATLGWNALVAMTLTLGGWGGWRLGRQLFPERPEAATILGLALACSPYLQGVALSSGRSEYWAWAWAALALSWTLSAMRAPTLPRLLRASIGLCALAWSGWQPMVFGLLMLGPATLLVGRGTPGRWGAPVGLAVVAGLAATPPLLAHLRVAPWWLERASGGAQVAAPARLVELWPWAQAATIGDRLMLPGFVLTALALSALWLGRGEPGARERWSWAALAASLGLLALGPALQMGALTLAAPGALLGPLPVLGGLSAWSRLAIVAALPLAVLAAHATVALHQKLGAWVLLAAPLLVVEGALVRPELPSAFYSRSLDTALELALSVAPPGAMLELPSAPVGLPLAQEALRDHALLQTRVHCRASSLVSSPEVPAAQELYPLLYALDHREPVAKVDCRLPSGLEAAGFAVVLLRQDHMSRGRAREAEVVLRAHFGEPVAHAIGWQLYQTDRRGSGVCE